MPTNSEKRAAASHQSLFREVNQRIRGLVAEETLDILCECADLECTELLHVGRDEYDELRSHSARFLVRPDHTVPGVERVVAEDEGHITVEKFGLAGHVAVELGAASAPQ